MVIAVALLLGGCNTLSGSLPSSISIPANDPSFQSRLYGGASIGSSSLDPNLSSAPAFNLASDSDQTTQMRLGYDIHNMLSVEVENSVLGAAELVEAGTSVKYSAFGVSALIYGINGVQNRSRREGWSAYGRLGYSYIKRSSAVLPLDNSNSSAVLGLGAEYGMRNGIGIRGEFTRYDNDASNFSIGAIYRFGLSAREIGNVFATAAKPALTSATSRVGANGRSRGNSDQGGPQNAPIQRQQTTHYPNNALAAQAWAPRVTRNDDDGDGISNNTDRCPDTSASSTVGSDGCGLFDATLSDVVFKPGSHWLTPKARGQLDKLADTLLAFPEARIQVRAHTDNKGSADINMSLSERRAEAVVEYMQTKGIAELQLEAIGLGESQPMDTNDTAAGRKRNRRVEIATLSNIDPDMWNAINERAEKEKIEIEVAVAAVAKAPKAPARSKMPSEPIFPTATAIAVPAIPKPGYVAGFTMTGVVSGVSFLSDSAALTESSNNALKELSDQLKAVPDVSIAIMAHTDNQGEESANQTLSVSRALAVVDFLVAQGISKPRLLPEGYGETLPLVQNVTDADRARNRRIEVRVLN